MTAQLVAGMGSYGGYTYELGGGTGRRGDGFDNSNSQYGLLGVWMAAEAGVEVPTSYWQTTDAFWRRVRMKDGGWITSRDGRERVALTPAGVASLYVAHYLDQGQAIAAAGQEPGGGSGEADRELGSDIAGFVLHVWQRAGGAGERAEVFWQEQLVSGGGGEPANTQSVDGNWDGRFEAGGGPEPCTAYALLFFVRGRNPVVFNKLQMRGRGMRGRGTMRT